MPHMIMQQSDSEVVLRMEVPGISPEDLDVTVDDETVTVRCTTREPGYGTYEWTLSMPPFVDLDKAAARYHQGVLEVRAPGPEA